MGAVVTAPLVVANGSDGKLRYVYAGAELPDDLAEGEAERLAALGLVENEKPSKRKPAAKADTTSGSAEA